MPEQPPAGGDENTVSWAELLEETVGLLQRSGAVDNPSIEARWIVEQATDTRGDEYFEVLSTLATVRGVAHLDAMVKRRSAGEPIQYVLGTWSFRSLELMIDRRVLIPRPETEVVTEIALAELDRQRPDGGGTAIDLGTGSGAIGLSIAAERAISRVLLTDRSEDAIAVARANLAGLGFAGRRVEISQGSWFDAVPERFLGECDVIVSNPPYVRSTDRLPAAVVEWEPEEALIAGPDGLDDLRLIIEEAPRWLRSGSALILEMDPSQTQPVGELMRDVELEPVVHRDLAGIDRIVVGRLR